MGKVHAKAEFDHALYCQVAKSGLCSFMHWEESRKPASAFVKADKSRGLVEPERHVFRRGLKGTLGNEDMLLRVA